jgi:hypothetical protein
MYLNNLVTTASKLVGYFRGIVLPNAGLPGICVALRGSVVVARMCVRRAR